MRLLKASEINIKPAQVLERRGKVYAMLLLYKDSRCDMTRMDEEFGPTNWKRTHRVIGENLYCSVSVYDKSHGQWVEKEDVGTKSDYEEQKGEASDAFKRACTNWGIGRELYTAPSVYVELVDSEFYTGRDQKIRISSSTKFHVSAIDYDSDRNIASLAISDTEGKERYRYGKHVKKEKKIGLNRAEAMEVVARIKEMGLEKYTKIALSDRGIAGLSQLDSSETEDFIREVEEVSKGK